MHRRAEYGVAAHWKYKEDVARRRRHRARPPADSDMQWLRQLLDWQNEVEDPGEFLDSLRFEINSAEVFVFTPRGDVIGLPIGSTPVDFAYAIHTEVGHHTIGARVNGRLVPLESELEHGDVVEVFTSKSPNAGPTRDWLTVREVAAGAQQDPPLVHQGAPRGGHRAGQGADRPAAAQGGPPAQAGDDPRVADPGRQRARGWPTSPRSTPPWARATSAPRPSYARCIEVSGGDDGAAEDLAEAVTITRPRRRGHAGARLRGRRQGRHRRAGQARPLLHAGARATRSSASSPGATGSRCTAATAPTPPSCSASPSGSPRSSGRRRSQSTFLVQIMVEALDRARLLSDITMVLSDQHVNILSASLTTNRDRVAKSRFAFEMGDPKHLGAILKAVRQVDGVFDAYRVTQ